MSALTTTPIDSSIYEAKQLNGLELEWVKSNLQSLWKIIDKAPSDADEEAGDERAHFPSERSQNVLPLKSGGASPDEEAEETRHVCEFPYFALFVDPGPEYIYLIWMKSYHLKSERGQS